MIESMPTVADLPSAATLQGPLLLNVLGGFQAVLADRRTLRISTKKTQALLAYLALNPGRPHGREKLIELLWGDRDSEHARNSLRQALSALRKDLARVEPQPIVVAGELLSVPSASIAVDVLAFERLARSDQMADLQQAAALYRGELLDGLAVRDAAFLQWLSPERHRIRELAIDVFSRLVSHLSGPAAIEAAHRLVELDPTREASQRTLIMLLAGAGEIEAALAQYKRYSALLEHELGIRPSAAAESLFKEIDDLRTTADAGAQSTVLRLERRLSGKPLIAVLPFESRSLDPEHRHFCDALAGDISDALSRISSLIVLARSSTAAYRGQTADVRRVARESGAAYVLQGSVLRLGQRLRIDIQLSDAPRGLHLWAEQYDCTAEEILDIEEVICRAVAASTETQIELSGRHRRSAPAGPLAVQDRIARGKSLLYDETAESFAEALQLADQAIALEPRDPGAHLLRAEATVNRLAARLVAIDAEAVAQALDLSRTALTLAPHQEWAHLCLARACIEAEDIETAIAESERALEFNPGLSNAIARLSECYALLGRSADAIAAGQLALKLNPRSPTNYWRHFTIALAHFAAGDDGAALQGATRVLHQRPDFVRAAAIAAASGAMLGRKAETEAAVALLQSRHPDLRSTAAAPKLMPRFARAADRNRLITGLQAAGLQE